MRQALALAAKGLGRTSPNPPVGCLLVKGERVIGRGFHARAGAAHAEAMALAEASEDPRGATAYVTLEPCTHYGRTPPCCAALVRAGIARVVIAARDVNPQAGGGLEQLRRAGLAVRVGVLEAQALAQQAGFRSLIARGRPWVIYKAAMTLDGATATLAGDSRWVSGEAARALVHRWRDQVDAIAVGRGTVAADDPLLTTRGVPGGRDARPVIFDRSARTPLSARALRPGALLVSATPQAAQAYSDRGVEVIVAAGLAEALAALAERNIATVMLEGGPTLAGAFLAAGFIDELRLFVAPKLLGRGRPLFGAPAPAQLSAALPLGGLRWRRVGEDLLLQGYLQPIPRAEGC